MQNKRPPANVGVSPNFCPAHGARFQFFCASPECLKFLCATCLQAHTKHADPGRLQSFGANDPQVDAPKNRIISCQDLSLLCLEKLKDGITLFQGLKEKIDKVMASKEAILNVENNLKVVHQLKDQLIHFVELYFTDYEIQYLDALDQIHRELEERTSQFRTLLNQGIENLKQLIFKIKEPDDPDYCRALGKLHTIDINYEGKAFYDKIRFVCENAREAAKIHFSKEKYNSYKSDLTLILRNDRMTSDKIGKEFRESTFRSSLAPLEPQGGGGVEAVTKLVTTMKDLDNVSQNRPFYISAPNYFKPECPNKVIHFFESGTKYLYVVEINNIITKNASGLFPATPRTPKVPMAGEAPDDKPLTEEEKQFFRKINLDINFIVPPRHRSVITPTGNIYLTGGFAEKQELCLDWVHVYNWENNVLMPRKKMIKARKSHGICCLGDFIYVVGGFTNEGFSNKCERYSISKDEWFTIANLNQRASSPAICAVDQKYIFKFGGLSADGVLTSNIERYDPNENVWIEFDIQNVSSDLRLLWLSSSVQINDSQILIFGGCLQDNTPTNQMILLDTLKDQDALPSPGVDLPYRPQTPQGTRTDNLAQEQKYRYKMKVMVDNSIPRGGLWNSPAIIHENNALFTQNYLAPDNPGLALEKSRTVIIFDSQSRWKAIGINEPETLKP